MDETLLITGGTGSFGRALTKRAIEHNIFKKVIIFSRDEWKQWEMKRSSPVFSDPRVRYFLGDIRDSERLLRALNEVDVVIHSAALKQIVAAEYNPTEFIKTNVVGAMHLTDACILAGVKKLLALSTDKAVNPVNLYGASKLCQDKLVVAANNYVGGHKFPKFSVVRYGNVANSRGSIIPRWQHLMQQGASTLPITDLRMSRFWITLDQAVDFVLFCLSKMQGGEIFIPKLPSFYIKDLAALFSLPIEVIGIRPGEKLDELLLSEEEARHSLEFETHYTTLPEFAFREDLPIYKNGLEEGQPLPDPFHYQSGHNTHWLSIKDLEQALKPLMAT